MCRRNPTSWDSLRPDRAPVNRAAGVCHFTCRRKRPRAPHADAPASMNADRRGRPTDAGNRLCQRPSGEAEIWLRPQYGFGVSAQPQSKRRHFTSTRPSVAGSRSISGVGHRRTGSVRQRESKAVTLVTQSDSSELHDFRPWSPDKPVAPPSPIPSRAGFPERSRNLRTLKRRTPRRDR